MEHRRLRLRLPAERSTIGRFPGDDLEASQLTAAVVEADDFDRQLGEGWVLQQALGELACGGEGLEVWIEIDLFACR
jgi:hypothetical protein